MLLFLDKKRGRYICKKEDDIYLLIYEKITEEIIKKTGVEDNKEFFVLYFDNKISNSTKTYDELFSELQNNGGDCLDNYTDHYFEIIYPNHKNKIKQLRILSNNYFKK